MATTAAFKNINMMTKEQYDGVSSPATDELYAISGSGFGLPSTSRYQALTLGATGTSYTAPANGWFQLSKNSTATGQFVYMGGNTSKIQVEGWASAVGSVQLILPVTKGTKIDIIYSAVGDTTSFIFVYAEGE